MTSTSTKATGPTDAVRSYLVRIEAPHFIAGVVVDESSERVVKCAPVLAYMKGWREERVRVYCVKKKWKCERTWRFER